jgi:NADH:ubiquinone oxidoreductase subunit 3 (subunit A)
MAIKHAVYRALHDLKVSYNYKLLEGRASHLATCPGPVPLDERLIFLKLDAHDSVGQIMATMYPRLVPLNQRLIIRALRQWDAVSAWFTGAVDAVQGPVLLRWLGLAGSDYLGRRFKAEETGVSKAVGGCSFPTRPQAMPLNVQYLPELTDYLRLCDAMCSWPPGLYSCVHFWVHFVPHFNLSLRWFLKVAALYTIPWYGVAVIAIVVSSLFVGATVLLALSFWRGFSLIHTAVLLEVSGASVVALAAIVGLAWYDPSGQVLALLLLMVSAWDGSFMWLTVAVGSDVTPAANGGLVGLLLGWIVAGVLAGVAVSVAASGLSYYLLAREKDMWSKGVWSNDWTDLDEALVPDGYTSVQDAVLRELDMWVSTMWPEFLVSWWPDRLWMLATPVPGQAGGELLPLFVLLCSVVVTVFALWLSLVSNRWYRSDFMALGSNYECGAEPLGERISAGDVLSFFKIVCVFLVFEWEWVLLFVAVPLLGVCGRAAVLVLSAFILLVELGVLAELRSGSSLFTKTK